MAGGPIPVGPGGVAAPHGPDQVSDAGSGGPNQTVTGRRVSNLHGRSVKQVRAILRAQGYNVDATGGMTQRLRTAVDAYTSAKPAHQWNSWAARHFSDPAHGANDPGHHTGVYGELAKVGKAVAAVAADPPAKGGKGKPPSKPAVSALAGLAQLSLTNNIPIPTSLANALVSGDDAAIKTVQKALAKAPGQASQNQADIQHWYGQVQAAQSTAAGRDKAISQAGQQSVDDSIKGIIASLGGAANEGSASVGEAGAADLGTLAATGAAQDQYNADIAPLLKDEGAGAATRQKALDSKAESDLRTQLLQAQGQRGTDHATALMNIIGQNNQMGQQNFQNQLALQQEQDSRKLIGIKAKSLNASPKALSNNQLGSAATAAYGMFPRDANGKVSTKGMSVEQIVKNVNNAYLQRGFDLGDPRVAASAMGTLRSLGITNPDPAWYGLGGGG